MGKEILYVYRRVSTDKQKDEGLSLEGQKEVGIEVSKKLGMDVDFDTYNESSRSSTIHYRPKLEELKEDIKSGKVKNIWIEQRSRMFRNFVESIKFRQDFVLRYNCTLYEGSTPLKFEFLTTQERTMFDMYSLVQQSENEERTERSKTGKRRRLIKDSPTKPVFLGGTPLFGYKNVDKLWKTDPTESKIVKWLFDSYEKGKSTREIKIELDKKGIPPRRTKNGLWSMGTLQSMLKNKSYTGLHSVNEYKVLDIDEITKRKTKEVIGTHSYKIPKIINVGQFNRVQKILEQNYKHSINRKTHFSLLENLLVCECGTRMGSRVKEITRKDGTQVNTRKYHCMSVEYKWKSNEENPCQNKKSLNMDVTNSYVLDYVKSTVSKSHLLKEKFKTEIMGQKESKEEDIKSTLKKLEKQHSENNRQIEDIENSIVELEVKKITGEVPENRVKEIVNRLEEHLDHLQKKSLEIEVEIEKVGSEKSWLDWVSKYGESVEIQTNTEKKQLDFLKGVVSKIVVNSDYGIKRKNVTQVGHSLSFHFNLKIVDDKLVYREQDKSKGYDVISGKKVSTGDTQKFITPRTRGSKKK